MPLVWVLIPPVSRSYGGHHNLTYSGTPILIVLMGYSAHLLWGGSIPNDPGAGPLTSAVTGHKINHWYF